jgi:hypothetical protein
MGTRVPIGGRANRITHKTNAKAQRCKGARLPCPAGPPQGRSAAPLRLTPPLLCVMAPSRPCVELLGPWFQYNFGIRAYGTCQ